MKDGLDRGLEDKMAQGTKKYVKALEKQVKTIKERGENQGEKQWDAINKMMMVFLLMIGMRIVNK